MPRPALPTHRPAHPGCPEGFLQFPARASWPHPAQKVGTVAEGWWGACNADESECLTVAGNSPLFAEAALTTSVRPQSPATFAAVPGTAAPE